MLDQVAKVAYQRLPGVILQQARSWLLKPELVDHDRIKFRESDLLLHERYLIDTLDGMLLSAMYRGKFISKSEKFICFFEEEGNQYINQHLQQASQNLSVTLNQFVHFVATRFFHVPEKNNEDPNNWRFSLYPELKYAKEQEKRAYYNRQAHELRVLILELSEEYRSYRKLIKQVLAI